MTRRIKIFSILITMVYWLGQGGCAAPGEAENYKILEDDRQRQLETNPEETLPGSSLDDGSPQRSVTAIDERNWPRTVVGPRDGRTVHGEILLRDLPLRHARTPLRVDDPPITQLATSLEGAESAGPLHPLNLLNLVAQPLKMGFDVGTLPAQAVLRRAWEPKHTP